jgi:hypothetical protein
VQDVGVVSGVSGHLSDAGEDRGTLDVDESCEFVGQVLVGGELGHGDPLMAVRRAFGVCAGQRRLPIERSPVSE